MKQQSLSVLLGAALIFGSCKEAPKPVEKKKDIPAKKSLIIGNPLDYGIDNMLIFPVGKDYKPAVFNAPDTLRTNVVTTDETTLAFTVNASATLNDRMASTEYVNSNEDEFDIRNILFYDQLTGKTYPLVADTIHILSFALHREFSNPLIFYRVVKKDINKDSLFNSQDPVMLFVSDLNGKNLTQITPENEQFVDYFYYEKTQVILAKTVIDGNGDGHFSPGDETNFREMKIKEPAMGREIFSNSLKDSLRLE